MLPLKKNLNLILLLVIFELFSIGSAFAETKIGDVFSDKFFTADGIEFPLPKGEWKLSNKVPITSPIPAIINSFTNLDETSTNSLLIILEYTKNLRMSDELCSGMSVNKDVIFFSRHGGTPTSSIGKCSAFGLFRNFKSFADSPTSLPALRAIIKEQLWPQTNNGDDSIGVAQSVLNVDRNNGKRYIFYSFNLSFNHQKLFERISSMQGADYAALNYWHSKYIDSLEESLLKKRFKSFADFDNTENLQALFANSGAKEIGPQKLVATSVENATKKDAPNGQEDPFEAARKQAEEEFNKENSFALSTLTTDAQRKEQERQLAAQKAQEQLRVAEETRIKEQQRIALEAQQKEQVRLALEAQQREQVRLAQEARQKEHERQLAEQNAKEQLRVAEETRIKEQQRIALEAQQKEQVRLTQEARIKDQQRLAEDARIKENQRLALESTEISRLRAEAEESKRKQAELEEQLRLAKQQNQVAPPSAMTTMANRKALVIGNDSYKSVSKLLNAREDAKAIAANLNTVGYQVTLKLDLNEKEMKAALRAFSSQVQGGDEVMFFFAGHGVQLGATNYLLPIDIGGESEAQVKDEAIQLQRILDDMSEKKSKFTLAMIDACRDNPFKTTGRAIGGRGMAPTTAATGQMVVFSAGTGQQALDRLGNNDKNKNGVFTRTFLKEMQKSGVSIDRIVKNVRNEVAELAKTVGHEQVPAIYDQVLGDFYFKK